MAAHWPARPVFGRERQGGWRSGSGKQRDTPRLPDSRIPRHEPHAVDEAGRRDDLIGGITTEIELPDRAAHIQREGPDVNPGQSSHKVRIIEIDLYSPQLRELADIPDHNRRDAPRFASET